MRLSNRSLLSLALLIVVLITVYFAGDLAPQSVVIGPGPSSLLESAEDTQLPKLLATGAQDPDQEASAPGSREVVAPLAPAHPESEEPTLAHLKGRFLLPSGTGAAGVSLTLYGWGANQERILKHGVPEDWPDITSITSSDGRFDLTFDPPLAYQFVLDAELEGFAALSWRWGSLPPNAVTDVGDQTFARSGTITGRVVRPDGSPAGGSWTVYGESPLGATGEDADGTSVMAAADAETGAFRLTGLPAGPVRVTAHSRMANWIDGPLVQVEAGRDVEADVVYAGPDNHSRITVVTFCRPFYAFNDPEPETITCSNAAGEEWTARKIEGSSQSYSFDDMPAGSYTIRIETDHHKAWSRAAVSPGEEVNASLEGSAAVVLQITDEDTGKELVNYELRLRFDGANFGPSVFQVREPGQALPPGGLYVGLIPHATTLIVQAEGYAPSEVKLGELRAHETRSVKATLGRGAQLRGRVWLGGGGAAPGVTVLLRPHREADDSDDPFSRAMSRSEGGIFEAHSRDVKTDRDGAFSFEAFLPGDYDLSVSHGGVQAMHSKLHLNRGENEFVELRLPATGTLIGTLLVPEGVKTAGLEVYAVPNGEAPLNPHELGWSEAPTLSTIDDQGRFRIDSLPTGKSRVFLYVASRMIPSSFSSSFGTRTASLDLGRVQVVAGVEVHSEFDLRDRFPGTIVIEATLNGAPASGCIVRAECNGSGRRLQDSGGQLDVNGQLRLSPMFVGDWDIWISGLGAHWMYKLPSALSLSSGQDIVVPIHVLTAKGRVRILDATGGEPVPNREVYLNGRHALQTDGTGWLDLELTAGSHFITASHAFFRGDANPGGQSLDWTHSGPVQTEISLEF